MQYLSLTYFGLTGDDKVAILEEYVYMYLRVGEGSELWEEVRKKDGKYGFEIHIHFIQAPGWRMTC